MQGDESATLADVARAAGLSTASVSRGLSGAAGVSATTRAEILRIARELNYTGNNAARALASGRTSRVGVTIPHVNGEVYTRILSGAAQTFHLAGLSLILETIEHQPGRHREAVRAMVQRGIDGALLMIPGQPVRELRALYESGLRFVVVDPVHPLNFPAPSVTCTNAAGAREAADHLFSLGHERIGVMAGEDIYATRERLHGVRQAFEAAGRHFDEDLVFRGSYLDPDGARQTARELLSRADRPTAIFALGDKLALGVLRSAYELGVNVPGELSVVGFDDIEAASLVSPALTTVRQPLDLIGTTAAEMLLRAMAATDDGPVMHVQLPTTLITRETTGSPI